MPENIKDCLRKDRITSGLKLLKDKGFFDIFTGTILVKCISFCSVIFLPRIINNTDQYGILSIVDNFNSYLILANGIGLANSILRFCSLKEKYEEKRAVFQFCFKWGLIINGIIIVIVLLTLTQITLSIKGLKLYLYLGLGIPTFSFVFECITLFLRSDLKNKEYSRLSIAYALAYAGVQILCAIGYKIFGVIIGRYCAFFIIVILGFYVLKNKTELFKVKTVSLCKDEKRELFLFAIGGLFANAFSLIMPLNEQMMITAILSNETQTAYYKAASLGPTNIQFIASAVVIFIIPYFARHTNDINWIKKKAELVMGFLALVILPISIILVVMSPWIIKVIFGEAYMPALDIMRIMWIAFSVNSIVRIPLGNILAAIGKIKFNLMLAVLTTIIHFILDYLCISCFGINGAAIALTIAYSLSGVINYCYIIYLSKKEV